MSTITALNYDGQLLTFVYSSTDVTAVTSEVIVSTTDNTFEQVYEGDATSCIADGIPVPGVELIRVCGVGLDVDGTAVVVETGDIQGEKSGLRIKSSSSLPYFDISLDNGKRSLSFIFFKHY